jgi:hypothetical protein
MSVNGASADARHAYQRPVAFERSGPAIEGDRRSEIDRASTRGPVDIDRLRVTGVTLSAPRGASGS